MSPVAFVGIFIPYGCGADGAEIFEGAGVDLRPVAFVGIFIPYGCGAEGAEIFEGADGAGGVNDMPTDFTGEGAPTPDRDFGGADFAG